MNDVNTLDNKYLVDIEHWIRLFPLEKELNSLKWPYQLDCHICGPSGLAIVEQVRRLCKAPLDSGYTVPTDVFIFSHGEPDRRDVTKVGGIPYRPATVPWPKTDEAGDMTFVAQYRFSESRDILPSLPGDVLLVFARDMELYSDDLSYFCFEWYPLGLTDLIRPEEVPKPSWRFVTCYAHRYRSVDYLDIEAVGKHIIPVIPIPQDDMGKPGPPNFSAVKQVCCYDGMKIGGGQVWVSEPEIPSHSRLLCSLGDIIPRRDSPYPWANWPLPIKFAPYRWDPDHVLYWWDGCQIFFFLTQDGRIEWRLHIA